MKVAKVEQKKKEKVPLKCNLIFIKLWWTFAFYLQTVFSITKSNFFRIFLHIMPFQIINSENSLTFFKNSKLWNETISCMLSPPQLLHWYRKGFSVGAKTLLLQIKLSFKIAPDFEFLKITKCFPFPGKSLQVSLVCEILKTVLQSKRKCCKWRYKL